jgi:bacteriorhodopsin
MEKHYIEQEDTLYKKEKKERNNFIIGDATFKKSFVISALILFGSSFITFIEALKTNSIRARHILNLETAVSLIAGYVYMKFVDMIDKKETISEEDHKQIVQYRYIDWFITTPLLILALIAFFTFYDKKPLNIKYYLLAIFFNAIMLYAGYLGETNQIHKMEGFFVGFAGYFGMLLTIWCYFVHTQERYHQKLIFFVFAIIWSFYGIAYLLDSHTKNLLYNILDVFSKTMFGLFMWAYYGNVVSI